MTATPTFNDTPGTLTEAGTLRMQRLLPGPADRVWAYLTLGELRRQWLAAGDMNLVAGATFELVWRNDELSTAPDERPAGFSAESRATCQILEVDPPHRLRYNWPGVGEVTIELKPEGSEVLLTLTHRQLVGETLVLNVCAGWHAHLARLVALTQGTPPPSLWRTWKALREAYAQRLGA